MPSSNIEGPSDIPEARLPSLGRLDALVGEWEMVASFEEGYFAPDSPRFSAPGGRTTFEWLPGGFFLVQRFTVDNPAAPSGIAIIGAAPDSLALVQHYYDSRGVARDYQMSLELDVWKLWREAPGFWQRFTGFLSPEGDTISGAWEGSHDGERWKHDFTLTYTRVG